MPPSYQSLLPRFLFPAFVALAISISSSRSQSFEIFEPAGISTSGTSYSTAANVSADGVAIIGSTTVNGFATIQAFIWRSDTGMFIITNAIEGIDVANGGDRAVVRDSDAAGEFRANLWTRTNGFQSIGRLSDGPQKDVEALAISADGKVIVGRAHSTNTGNTLDWEAFKWSAETGIIGLGDVMGDPMRDKFYSEAKGVSANGAIIVGTVRYGGTEPNGSFGYYAAARWTNGVGPQMLLPSPYNDLDFGAGGISANGRFILASSSIGAFEETLYDALRWSEDGGYTNLYEGQNLFVP